MGACSALFSNPRNELRFMTKARLLIVVAFAVRKIEEDWESKLIKGDSSHYTKNY